jgi:hemerythrin
MAIVWRDQMAIDGGVIDDDHKCLIAIVNDFEAIVPGPGLERELETILDRLEAYGRLHFEREERLQAAASFPDAKAHARAHQDLLRRLIEMRAVGKAAQGRRQLAAYHDRLCAFLHHWLVDHIVTADLAMRPFVARIRAHTHDLGTLGRAVEQRQAAEPAR